jgi:FtsP/CotA-like multicopper oxidase with cupredoxin domain
MAMDFAIPLQKNHGIAFEPRQVCYPWHRWNGRNVLTHRAGGAHADANSNEDDVHTPNWHSQTLLFNGMRSDMVHLEPMMMEVADMVPDNVGTWLLHCHVNEHIEGGTSPVYREALIG